MHSISVEVNLAKPTRNDFGEQVTAMCNSQLLRIFKKASGLVAQAVRRSPPTAALGSRGRVSVTPCGFRGGRNGVWVGFSRVSPVFPYHKFHSTISPHSSHPFRFISSALVMVRQALSAGTLATHGPIIWGFITSHLSTRPCVGHELRIFIYFKLSSVLENYITHIKFYFNSF